MTKSQERLLRIRAKVNKKARAEYAELQEKRLHADVCQKAQAFRDREVEDLVASGAATVIGDEVVMIVEAASFHTSASADDYSEVQGGIEVTAEADVTHAQLKKMINKHYTPPNSKYRRNEVFTNRVDGVDDDEPGIMDPATVRRFTTTEKMPKNDVADKLSDVDALKYFSARNSGR
jgi:hypothetical protein